MSARNLWWMTQQKTFSEREVALNSGKVIHGAISRHQKRLGENLFLILAIFTNSVPTCLYPSEMV